MPTPLFQRISLTTTLLEDQKRFYTQILGLSLVLEGSGRFIVEAGATELEFREVDDPTPRLYHYAFNIPENQIEEALAWTQKRTAVEANKRAGGFLYDFASWDSHAFYFLDAEGNILEFIARHKLNNASTKPFSGAQMQCVSELGVVTEDVAGTSQALIDTLGLSTFPDPGAQPGDDFQAIGSEQGLFIVVRKNRVWLGSELTATPFPAEVVLTGSHPPLSLADALCQVG